MSRFGTLLIALVAMWMAVSIAVAQDSEPVRTDQEAANAEAIDRFGAEVLVPGDFERIGEFMSEEYVIHTPLGDLDRDGLVGFIGALRASMPDLSISREIMLAEGNYVASRSVFAGTFSGAEFLTPMGALPPNDAPVTIYVNIIFLFGDDGRVIEEWAIFDALGFFTQLGAFPAPDA
jgi:predicted ester cyclase